MGSPCSVTQQKWQRPGDARDNSFASVRSADSELGEEEYSSCESLQEVRRIAANRQKLEDRSDTGPGSCTHPQDEKTSKQGYIRLWVWVFVLLIFGVVLLPQLAGYFNFLSAERALGRVPPKVRLQVQTATLGGYKLPTGETPDSLAAFLNKHSSTEYYVGPYSGGPSVYATIAESNRNNEIIRKDQVINTEGLAAFIVIWIKPLAVCKDDFDTQDAARYIRDQFKVDSVAFVCYWNGLSKTVLTEQSLKTVDQALLQASRA